MKNNDMKFFLIALVSILLSNFNIMANAADIEDILSPKAQEVYNSVESVVTPDISEINDVSIYIDGKEFDFENALLMDNNADRTFLSCREVAELLSADVDYYDQYQMVTIKKDDDIIEVFIAKPQGVINGEAGYIDPENKNVAPLLYNNVTYLPIRYLAEALNFEVEWVSDNDESKICIETKADNKELNEAPFSVVDNLFDESKTDLGLTKVEGAETHTIFSADEGTDHYVNGVFMTEFNGKIYCQWQSSAVDEDAEDTWVAYSVSDDGVNWSEPKVLVPTIENGYCSSGGWYVNGDTLVSYVNVWHNETSPRGGFAHYVESKDGVNWSEMKPVMMKDGSEMNGIIEQDPHTLESGRIVCAAHFQPGLFANPIYTDDKSGVKGWVRAEYTNMETDGETSREMEPSLFVNSDNDVVMIFRDQDSTFYKLASISKDQGETWSNTVLTNMPDSRSKQSAGNLPDATAYLVGNSVTNKLRIPLTITLSKDGKTFDTAYVLRTQGDIPELKYEGKAKRLGYHYPKSVVIGDYLYVSYATNKEHVDFTRIPLDKISLN